MKTQRYGRILVLALGCLVGWLSFKNQKSDLKVNIEVSGFSQDSIMPVGLIKPSIRIPVQKSEPQRPDTTSTEE